MFAMRMSQPDYDRIQHKAGQAGMSMTGFLTASALNKNIVVVDGLDKVLAELKAIGQELAMYIATLPMVEDVNQMMKKYYQGVYERQTDFLSKTIREEHQQMTNTVTTNMNKTTDTIGWKLTNTLEHWEEKLRHRDMSPFKIKAKWAGIGVLISTILWLLLKLLTTL